MSPRPAATSRVLLVVTLLLVAANVRPVITAVGPVIDLIGADQGLSAARLGLLGAIPLLAFGTVSPLVHRLSGRFGVDRTLLWATVALLVGTVVRSTPGLDANLWVGTVVLGVAIAVCNVLVPVVVRRDFPGRIAMMTGLYSAVLGATAAVASGLALPVAGAGGWRLWVGVWVVFTLAALVPLALTRARGAPAGSPPVDGPARSVWRTAVGWQVSFFMGAQATTFYLLVTWLPSVEVSLGFSPVAAGWLLFVYQFVGIFAGLGVGAVVRGHADYRAVGGLTSLLLVVATVGLLTVPQLSVVWVVLAGLSSGSTLVVALALVAERARDATEASRLSGMAQCVGYLMAAAGPVGAGLLFSLTGSWTWPLVAVVVVTLLQTVDVLVVGRDRRAVAGPVAASR